MAKETNPHIGIFGRRNIGKSSIINALAKQEISIISNIPGTTTDPVKKSIEIPGIGPVVLIDTAGIDDSGELGEKRVKKTLEIINAIDLAIIVVSDNNLNDFENKIINQLKNFEIPYFLIHNKSDIKKLTSHFSQKILEIYKTEILEFSALRNPKTESLISLIKKFLPESAWKMNSIIGDLVSYGDFVLLITPIDTEAPEGRLILPQVQVIRDILDNECVAIVLKEREVDEFLNRTQIKPKLVVTDSSILLKADAMIPKDVSLTGFSILLARFKGPFHNYLEGTKHISKLKNGDRVLILESCTHHVSCDDIGRVKIPRWISQFTGKKLDFDSSVGLNPIPNDIKKYSLVIQCGGCMITRKQIFSRLKPAIDAGVPVTNYGLAIAYVQGIFNRAIKPFLKDTNIEEYL